MPTYQYECANPACAACGLFEVRQSIHDDALAACPTCGGPVDRIIQPTRPAIPRSDTDLRDLGFAKLVKRDQGVYENVTAMSHESRYMKAGRPETMPDLSKRIAD